MNKNISYFLTSILAIAVLSLFFCVVSQENKLDEIRRAENRIEIKLNKVLNIKGRKTFYDKGEQDVGLDNK